MRLKKMNRKINPVYLILLILIVILLSLLSVAINDWQTLGYTFKEKISILLFGCAMWLSGVILGLSLWGGKNEQED